MSRPAGRVCGVCGAPAPPPFRAPQPEIAPDLDLRPGEPARSTLDQWVRACRRCGTAAPDLAALPAAVAQLDGGAGAPWRDRTVAPVLRWAALCHALADPAQEAEALLQAAWAADDRGEDAEAASLRLRVAALWQDTDRSETALRRLDVLRRAGAWQEAAAWAERLGTRDLDATARAILAFQGRRIAARDAGRHLISAALPPPAHAPHVTHQRRQPPGLFARLFGRR